MSEIAKLSRLLSGAKRRCSKEQAYRHVAFEFASPKEGALALYNKLGPLPDGMSLDRIDPRGPYSLDNLKYSTAREQARNTRYATRFWSDAQ